MTDTTTATVLAAGAVAQVDAAVAALREATEQQLGVPGAAGDIAALDDVLHMVDALRARLASEPVLDGPTRLVPAASIARGDRLIGADGTATEVVTAVTRRSGGVSLYSDTGDQHDMSCCDRVEIASSPAMDG